MPLCERVTADIPSKISAHPLSNNTRTSSHPQRSTPAVLTMRLDSLNCGRIGQSADTWPITTSAACNSLARYQYSENPEQDLGDRKMTLQGNDATAVGKSPTISVSITQNQKGHVSKGQEKQERDNGLGTRIGAKHSRCQCGVKLDMCPLQSAPQVACPAHFSAGRTVQGYL